MEFTGKVLIVKEPVSGVSKNGNNWMMQDVVLEEINTQYPKKCVFNIFGEDRIKAMDVKEGEVIKAYLNIDATEYNGKWYNRVTAWKIEREQQSSEVHESPTTTMNKVREEDLPF